MYIFIFTYACMYAYIHPLGTNHDIRHMPKQIIFFISGIVMAEKALVSSSIQSTGRHMDG